MFYNFLHGDLGGGDGGDGRGGSGGSVEISISQCCGPGWLPLLLSPLLYMGGVKSRRG